MKPHGDIDGGPGRIGFLVPEGAQPRLSHGSHAVQFYREEGFLVDRVTRFIRAGLHQGDAVIVVATGAHLEALRHAVASSDVDPGPALELGRLKMCEATEILSELLTDGMPDEARFRDTIGELIEAARISSPTRRVRAYGEMVDVLWKSHRPSAMLRLEELWEALARERSVELLCGYQLDAFAGDEHTRVFEDICSNHGKVMPSERYLTLNEVDRMRAFAELEQRASSLELEVERRKSAEIIRDRADRASREEAEKRRLETELLFRLTEAVNQTVDIESVYEPALDAVCSALRVYRAAILLFDDDGKMRFKAWRGLSEIYRNTVEGHSPWTRDAKDPQPIFVSDVEADPGLAGFRPVFDDEGIGALGFIPLTHQGTLLGKFMVYASAPRAFTSRDAQLAGTIASQVAQAVSRSVMIASERQNRERAERLAARTTILQEITASLSTASTRAQVADAAVVLGGGALGAAMSAIWLNEPGEAHAVLLREHGVPRDPGETRPPAPVVEAIATREPVWTESAGELTSACLPLNAGARCAGALVYGYTGRAGLSKEEKDFLLVIARHTAAALERARLYDLETRARSLAEGMQHRSAFLLEASVLLSSSLDFQETLKGLARIAVPRIADWCEIELATDPARPSSLLVAHHVSEERAAMAYELRRRYPLDPSAGVGVASVMRTGRAELHADGGDALLSSLARDAEHLEQMRRVGYRSFMAVPMIARGRTFGAISFGIAEGARAFGPADLELADLLGRRAAISIDNALLYEAASAAARAREEVLAVVSHDLRNPLGVVLMSAGNLLRVDAAGEKAEARVKKNAAIIQRSAERMSRLIEDLVDFGSMQVGRFTVEPRPCSASEIAGCAVEMFGAMARAQELVLEIDVPADLSMIGDRDRVVQALGNLLSNAVKVTAAGGKVVVAARREGPEVVISVSDTGPGLRPDELPRLFERFWRSERTTYKGTGLGLAIAKGIVEAHGGRIWAESTVGVGSKFSFSIPAAAP